MKYLNLVRKLVHLCMATLFMRILTTELVKTTRINTNALTTGLVGIKIWKIYKKGFCEFKHCSYIRSRRLLFMRILIY